MRAALEDCDRGVPVATSAKKQSTKNDENNQYSENYINPDSITNVSSISQKTPIKMSSDIVIKPAYKPSPLKVNNQTIPSPFKRVLMWPDPTSTKKKRPGREKIPSIVTSKQWQEYYQKKEDKKKMMKWKKNRELKRGRKKGTKTRDTVGKKKNKPKKIKKSKRDSSSSDTEASEEWESSGNTDDDISLFDMSNVDKENISFSETALEENHEPSRYDYKENEYILAEFPGKKRKVIYVCVIQEILSRNEAEVMGMKKCEDEKIFKLNERVWVW